MFDTNGYATNFAGSMTDVQRVLTVTNSAAGTTGSVGFGSFDIGSTAMLELTGGSAATDTNLDVSFGSGVVRQGTATLILDPQNDTDTLGGDTKVTQTTAPTLTDGIVAPDVIVEDDDNANNTYNFATYNADGYAAAAPNVTALSSTTNNSVVQQAANQTLTGNAAAYALDDEKGVDVTVGTGNTLTLGDGTDPAGLILNGGSGSGITGGMLAFGGSEGDIFTHGGSTISSEITGTGGLTFNGSGTLTLSTASTETGALTINSGTLELTAQNVFATNPTGITLEDNKSHPAAATLDLTASNQFAALNSTGNNSTVDLSGGAVLTVGNTTSNLSSTLSSAITETGAATTGALTVDGSGMLDLSGESSKGLTLVTGSTVVVNGGTLRIAANIFKNPNTVTLNNGAQMQFAEGGGSPFANDITGDGSVELIGGTLQLTGTNSYTGGTIVETGSTLDTTTANLPTENENITAAGGVVDFDQATNGTFTGVISDGAEMGTGPVLSGSLIKDDSSGANSGDVMLADQQTYTGSTSIEAGTLTLGAVNTIADSSGVTLGRVGGGATATLALAANNQIATLADNEDNTDTVQLNGNTLTIAPGAGVTNTFYGTITGGGEELESPLNVTNTGGELVIQGDGSQVLDGDSTIGTTSVQSGVLGVGDANTPTASITGESWQRRSSACKWTPISRTRSPRQAVVRWH